MAEDERQEFTIRTGRARGMEGVFTPAMLWVRCIRRKKGKVYRLKHDEVCISTTPGDAFKFDRIEGDPASGTLNYMFQPTDSFLKKYGSHHEEGVEGEVEATIDELSGSEALLEKFIVYLRADPKFRWDVQDFPEQKGDELRGLVETGDGQAGTRELQLLVTDLADRPLPNYPFEFEIHAEDTKEGDAPRFTSKELKTDAKGKVRISFQSPKTGFFPGAPFRERIVFKHTEKHGEHLTVAEGEDPPVSQPEKVGELEVFYKPELSILVEKEGFATERDPIAVDYEDEVILRQRAVEVEIRGVAFIPESGVSAGGEEPQYLRGYRPLPADRKAKPDSGVFQTPSGCRRFDLGGAARRVEHAKVAARTVEGNVEVAPVSGIHQFPTHTTGEGTGVVSGFGDPRVAELRVAGEVEGAITKLMGAVLAVQTQLEAGSQLSDAANDAIAKGLESLASYDLNSSDGADHPEHPRNLHKNLWAAAEAQRLVIEGWFELGTALPLYEKAYTRVSGLFTGLIIEMLTPDIIDDAARKIATRRGGPSAWKTAWNEGMDEVKAALLKKAGQIGSRLAKYASNLKGLADDAVKLLDDAAEQVAAARKALDGVNKTLTDWAEFVAARKSVLHKLKNDLWELGVEAKANQRLLDAADAARDLARKAHDGLRDVGAALKAEVKRLDLGEAKVNNTLVSAKSARTRLAGELEKLGTAPDVAEKAGKLRWQLREIDRKIQGLAEELAAFPSKKKTLARRLEDNQKLLESERRKIQSAADEIRSYEDKAKEFGERMDDLQQKLPTTQEVVDRSEAMMGKIAERRDKAAELHKASLQDQERIRELHRHLGDQQAAVGRAEAAVKAGDPKALKAELEEMKGLLEAAPERPRAVIDKLGEGVFETDVETGQMLYYLDKSMDKTVKWRQLYKTLGEMWIVPQGTIGHSLSDWVGPREARAPKFFIDLVTKRKEVGDNFKKFVEKLDKSAIGKGVGYEFGVTEAEKLSKIGSRQGDPVPDAIKPDGNDADEGGLLYQGYSLLAGVGRTVAKAAGDLAKSIGESVKGTAVDLLASLIIKFVSWILYIVGFAGRLFIVMLEDWRQQVPTLRGGSPEGFRLRGRLREVAGLDRTFMDPARTLAPFKSLAAKAGSDLDDLANKARLCLAWKVSEPVGGPKGNYDSLITQLQEEGRSALIILARKAIQGTERVKSVDPDAATQRIEAMRKAERRDRLLDLSRTFELAEGKGDWKDKNNIDIADKLMFGAKWADGRDRYFNAFNIDHTIDYVGWILENMARAAALFGVSITIISWGTAAPLGLTVTAGGILASELIGVVRMFLQFLFALYGTVIELHGWHEDIMLEQMESFEFMQGKPGS